MRVFASSLFRRLGTGAVLSDWPGGSEIGR
jgi:hypothetical protein